MVDVEVLGTAPATGVPSPPEVRNLCLLATHQLGVREGHVAVEFVDTKRIAELNEMHRNHSGPTDVLSFPIDGLEPLAVGERRELGDIVICPEHTADVREAIVHGMLHLLGMDHESDDGEMLALQQELLAQAAA